MYSDEIVRDFLIGFWGKVDRQSPSGCWLWTGGKAQWGYGKVYVAGRQCRAHRVSWEIAHQETIPEGAVILHTCDVPACVNPGHLVCGTAADNMADKMTKGRHRWRAHGGSENGGAKLSPGLVASIRSLHLSGMSYRLLAQRNGVSKTQVARIVKGNAWRDVLVGKDDFDYRRDREPRDSARGAAAP